MKINGTNINDLPEQLLAITNAIAALITVTDVCATTPDIRAGFDLTEMRGVKGVFFAHQKGSIDGIYAGGVDITEIVATSAWNECEEQAVNFYIDRKIELRTAAEENRADIKAGK